MAEPRHEVLVTLSSVLAISHWSVPQSRERADGSTSGYSEPPVSHSAGLGWGPRTCTLRTSQVTLLDQGVHWWNHDPLLSCLSIGRVEQREERWWLILPVSLQCSPWVQASPTLLSPTPHWGQINLPTAQP